MMADQSLLQLEAAFSRMRRPSRRICRVVAVGRALAFSVARWRRPRSKRQFEHYNSTCSEMARVSSTSIPMYCTVLSSFWWPSKSRTARSCRSSVFGQEPYHRLGCRSCIFPLLPMCDRSRIGDLSVSMRFSRSRVCQVYIETYPACLR